NKLMATGTTLGADDGVGVAQTMAIIEDDTLIHPEIEALFTIDEETDMKGAWNFDCSQLKGKTLINLDSCARMVAGSGELEYKMRFPKKTEKIREGSKLVKIEIGGLVGGHTGQNSMLERGNAIMLVNRILLELKKEVDYQLVYMQGGRGLSSAYARSASAILAFAPEVEGKVSEICSRKMEISKYELEHRDPGVRFDMQSAQSLDGLAMAEETADTLRRLILLLPDGVFTRNRVYEGCMESTSNVGVVETEETEMYLTILIRSFMENRKYYLLDKVENLCKILNVKTELGYNIPHWEFCVSDGMMQLAEEIYPDAPVTVAQGTLETGIFCAHMPDVEIIALACPYYNAHSPEEYLLLDELE
ncbi:MAG: M20/M25/M40 family metallo-hydrolase, partial [Verrucomicrobiae bacterium]|nr:M20/M25/M40 family metallo-hydrolase [Verrucomicrobiae bacterium]